jgi:hypothetical protein
VGIEGAGKYPGTKGRVGDGGFKDIIGRGIATRESTRVTRIGLESEVRVAVIAIGHAMSDQNHVPRPGSTVRGTKTLRGRLEETAAGRPAALQSGAGTGAAGGAMGRAVTVTVGASVRNRNVRQSSGKTGSTAKGAKKLVLNTGVSEEVMEDK